MARRDQNHPLALWLLGALTFLAGCAPEAAKVSDGGERQLQGVELTLLVVDDPAMAAAIQSLRSEWKARSGATLNVVESTSNDLLDRDALQDPADAIIYPASLLGPLAERDWLAPLPADYAKNEQLAWPDTFELLQIAETQWGQVAYAVPFGSPVLTCFYRPDLLEKIHRRPPETWSEYQELAALLAKRENLGDAAPPADAPWFAVAEPLADGWAGRTLLARAAAYAKSRDHYSTLFNIETMEPLIAGPAFVRALEELVAAAKLAPPNVLELDPAAARAEFYTGHCALALSWPGHSGGGESRGEGSKLTMGFAELPGAKKVYNFADQLWEDRGADEGARVSLLSLAGRLGSITRQSLHGENAFQLLCWLTGLEWGPRISSASPATTLYRRSQLRAPQAWLDPETNPSASQQYAQTVRDALSRQSYLFALRVPGQEEYLAALDTAVAQAVRGEKPPAEALQETSAKWKEITQQIGNEAQRKAYRASLGLEP